MAGRECLRGQPPTKTWSAEGLQASLVGNISHVLSQHIAGGMKWALCDSTSLELSSDFPPASPHAPSSLLVFLYPVTVIIYSCKCNYMLIYRITVNHWTWGLSWRAPTQNTLSFSNWHCLWNLSSLSSADFTASLPLLLQLKRASYCIIINCLHSVPLLKYKLIKDKDLIFLPSFFQHWGGTLW